MSINMYIDRSFDKTRKYSKNKLLSIKNEKCRWSVLSQLSSGCMSFCIEIVLMA